MADICHDLRNPVHAIGLVTSLLRITKMLDDIADNQRLDLGIVLSRTGWSGEELLRDAIEMFRPVADEHGVLLHTNSIPWAGHLPIENGFCACSRI